MVPKVTLWGPGWARHFTKKRKMAPPEPVWKTSWKQLPNISKPSPSKPWKRWFGLHETIGFIFPVFPQNVRKSGPKRLWFETLWPLKSEKGRPKNLQENHENSTATKHRNPFEMEYFFLVCWRPFFNFVGLGTHLAPKAPQSKKNVTKRSQTCH